MSLVDHLHASRTPLELAKLAVATAKENAQLRDQVDALEHELFWTKVAMKNEDNNEAASARLPARRFENVTGFADADYVEFAAGAASGGGVLNGVPYEHKNYSRDEAERFVAEGIWREVPIPATNAASAPKDGMQFYGKPITAEDVASFDELAQEVAAEAASASQSSTPACPRGCTGPEQDGSGCMAVVGDCAMDAGHRLEAGSIGNDPQFFGLLGRYAIRYKEPPSSPDFLSARAALIAHIDSRLAHVARQRQESAIWPEWQELDNVPCDTFVLFAGEFGREGWRIKMGEKRSEDGKIHLLGASWKPSLWMRMPPIPGARPVAPAEGVDTADFWKLVRKFSTAPEGAPRDEAKRAVLDHIATTYGAQQREAGRRERAFYIKDMEDTLSKIGVLVGVEQDADALIKAVAALARQPVSEGLTALREAFVTYMACPTPRNYDALLETIPAVCDGAAVPPAKAEGPNDSARYQWMRRTYVSDTEFWPDDVAEAKTGEELDSAIDRAILAQQAKKGGAA